MITTEILAAYLPHELTGENTKRYGTWKLVGVGLHGASIICENVSLTTAIEHFKPILRPLSELKPELYGHDLTKATKNVLIKNILKQSISVKLWNKLLADHYNVFNLPEGEYVKKV